MPLSHNAGLICMHNSDSTLPWSGNVVALPDFCWFQQIKQVHIGGWGERCWIFFKEKSKTNQGLYLIWPEDLFSSSQMTESASEHGQNAPIKTIPWILCPGVQLYANKLPVSIYDHLQYSAEACNPSCNSLHCSLYTPRVIHHWIPAANPHPPFFQMARCDSAAGNWNKVSFLPTGGEMSLPQRWKSCSFPLTHSTSNALFPYHAVMRGHLHKE